ncbi:hypothetical protein PsYK624_137220 [Phanerochaete sordida]|uniref:Uncharacterized protein n=1 Tax=Phanerochaete sordida TaxID=48140 RepID=A0A9P3GMJ1_9APHY|nr:hypothetical protein PsYK624_137220 [Phanerochaete sordida]
MSENSGGCMRLHASCMLSTFSTFNPRCLFHWFLHIMRTSKISSRTRARSRSRSSSSKFPLPSSFAPS